MTNPFDAISESWDKLSDREQRLLGFMGAAAALVLVFVLVWTTSTALSEVEDERDALRAVITDIDRAGDALTRRRNERMALNARYETKAPALAAFIESKAKEHGLEVRQVLEEPEKVVNGYRKQSVRVSFSNIGLRPLMHLLSAVESEPSAIAIDRLVVEHYAAGDSYKVDLGLSAYEAPEKGAKASSSKPEGGAP
jgi:type II secretory pathway component PulM